MSTEEPRAVEPAGHSAAISHPIGSPRDFALAGIGLLSLLADEIPALLERSVQRGSAVMERAQTEAKHRRAARVKNVSAISPEVQSELVRRGLPTHADLARLMQQVTELEQQIDRIAAQRTASK